MTKKQVFDYTSCLNDFADYFRINLSLNVFLNFINLYNNRKKKLILSIHQKYIFLPKSMKQNGSIKDIRYIPLSEILSGKKKKKL